MDRHDPLGASGRTLLGGAPEGFDARLIGDLAAAGRAVIVVARDDVRATRIKDALAFFHPTVACLHVPAWDCLPYDRVSPLAEIVGRRIDSLSRLAEEPSPGGGGRVVLTTVSAFLQRIPPRAALANARLEIAPGGAVGVERLVDFLVRTGFAAAETVREPGEYAVRGGIVDLFPPGAEQPLRVDFFGDVVETIRAFDPTSQRSTGAAPALTLRPNSEVPMDRDSVARFRLGYRALFGAPKDSDVLYEAISAGRRFPGMEHWLPLFHERLETIADYLPDGAIVLDHLAEDARDARLDLIGEYYQARLDFSGNRGEDVAPYHPLPPDRLYLSAAEWDAILAARPVGLLSPFVSPDATGPAIDAEARPGRDFSDIRVRPDANLFDAVRDAIGRLHGEGRRVVVTAYSAGSRDRLATLFAEHGLQAVAPVADWPTAVGQPPGTVALAVLPMERGFVAPGIAVITEQDILGERLVRAARRRVRPENFIAEASALVEGDLVVHVDHGIGRYDGLVTIAVAGAPHDCLRIVYEGGDKLFVPVENIEMLSRYGSEQAGVALDRLGGVAWQARKARLRQRIRDMAAALIKVAAARALKPAPMLAPPEGLFDEFCARFPYVETEDQARAIDETLADLTSGHPMDRLVCGDVGFGKTEVALRAAFVAVMGGKQVAVVVPTTLLARQHHQTFSDRFAGLPARIGLLSRLVGARQAEDVKRGLAEGRIDIVVGTHALLSKTVRFKDLGLVVVDEEQHFGVAHKERLKHLKTDVHVLTLSAAPIPRTLQMALSGVRELSLITTPPVDRLAVRTFILPYDPVIVREAILRERYRGGQTFYVCPRIEDLDEVHARLRALVPEVTIALAHGRMAASALERAMAAFCDHRFDVLLSTQIIELGLDLPTVNTIVIHRADMFGLAQLYQLRGRVGRSKVRAYAYLTLPARQRLGVAAQRRLEVMHTLDSLGAGFSLASHDLDLRGAGNLLGEEQSGHIREVGIELYQQMLEEAVAEARGTEEAGGDEEWSPQIALGMPVLIPEAYVADLGVRLGLYRRVARLADRAEIDAFAAELVDRFGPLPPEVDNLLQIVELKQLCRQAAVEKLEAGPKGAVVSFRARRVANPAALVQFIAANAGTAKLRPDHALVYMRDWDTARERLEGARRLMRDLAVIATVSSAA